MSGTGRVPRSPPLSWGEHSPCSRATVPKVSPNPQGIPAGAVIPNTLLGIGCFSRSIYRAGAAAAVHPSMGLRNCVLQQRLLSAWV